ncbi:DNA circularization N-terminal domain-containing protein [Ancylobacter sp. WKF20]|uniref:DNA circularization N-terminal domain-containing protein n=1 Tax=Ancylobacter sp. WKF20 TaxID=3039801 RepID=UPI002434476F|nr:DNA circularization N-terminal domain-containing protein [Ancylobacter sp. WKF20]WGD31200.1 DNA circularization N-terminal domain-containing protein [Ancylobacter sp. WKF20]
MRNWQKALRRASFRGVRFWVEEDGPERGRRVAVHNIAAGEAPVTEDLGRVATEYRVRAYVASDSADAEGWALEAACSAPGPSLLTLPMDPAALAHCVSCRRSRTRDQAGYVAYDLLFVEASGGAAGGGITGSVSGAGISVGFSGGGLSLSGGVSLGGGLSLGGLSAGIGVNALAGITGVAALRSTFSVGLGAAGLSISAGVSASLAGVSASISV